MAYDGVHVVMYGGWNAYTYGDWFGDMWQWTGSDWLPLTISGSNPGAR
jgi:hypothetical protein